MICAKNRCKVKNYPLIMQILEQKNAPVRKGWQPIRKIRTACHMHFAD